MSTGQWARSYTAPCHSGRTRRAFDWQSSLDAVGAPDRHHEPRLQEVVRSTKAVRAHIGVRYRKDEVD